MWSWMSVCSQINLPLELNTLFLCFCFPNHVWLFNYFLLKGEKSLKDVSLHPYLPLPVLYKHAPLLTNGGNQIQMGLWMLTSPSVFFPLPFPTCPPSPTQELHSIQVSLATFPFLLLTTSSHHIPACQLMSRVIQDMLSVLLWCLSSTTSAFHFSFSHSLSHLDFYQLLSCLLHSPFLPNSMLLS